MIGFPSSPTVGLTHSYGGYTWEWTGSGWRKQATGGPSSTVGGYIEAAWKEAVVAPFNLPTNYQEVTYV